MTTERFYAAEVLGDIDAGKMPNAATAYRAMDEAERLRAQVKALRLALERLNDICVAPAYRQACFADATAQARAALEASK